MTPLFLIHGLALALPLENEAKPLCFQDRFRSENLKNEITQLEREHPDAKEKYLKLFSDPLAIDRVYSQARDSKGDEGELIYLWFLKMGNMISASSNLLGYPKMNEPLSQYLFSSDELRAMVETAFRISEPYTKLWTLEQIQKVPSGHSLDPLSPLLEAGLSFFPLFKSSSEHSVLERKAWINLAADFIPLTRPEYTSTSRTWGAAVRNADLRDVLIHELSHQVDLTLDNPLHENPFRLSTRKEWLLLGGWQREVRDSTIFWTQSGKGEGFITQYAKTNPIEDFAETASHFITDPEKMKKMLPKKNQFISDWLYQGRTFDDEARFHSYSEFFKNEMLTRIPSQLMDCLQGDASLDIPAWIDPLRLKIANESQKKCLFRKWSEDLNQFAQTEMQNEWNACDDLKAAPLQALAQENLNVWLSELNRLPDFTPQTVLQVGLMVKKWQQWLEGFSPADAYIKCQDSSALDLCYQKQWADYLESFAGDTDLQAFLLELKMNAPELLSLSAARVQAIKALGRFMVEFDALLVNEMKKIWTGCLSAPEVTQADSAGELNDSILSSLDSYVRPGILKCISLQMPDRTRELLELKKINSSKFVISRFEIREEQIFNNFADQSSDAESQDWDEFYQRYQSKLPQPIRKNKNCIHRQKKVLNENFKQILEGTTGMPTLNFMTLEDVAEDWAEKLCK